jgi:hypothetical protein
MNVFQEVFASVNPRSREILREIENGQQNIKRTTKPEARKPRVSLCDPPVPVQAKPLVQESRERRFGLPLRVDRARPELCSDPNDEGNSSRSKSATLQSQIATVAEQIQIVEGSLRLAHSQNLELYRRNLELECHVASLRQAATETNKSIVLFKAQFAEKAAVVEANWEAQMNELVRELEGLRAREASVLVS